MKIIFSRKGFDSEAGCVPSPIFRDNRLCYLPIPSHEALTYSQLSWEGRNLGEIVENVTDQRIPATHGVHLDPDIDPQAIRRKPGWRGLFGQTGAPQTHLNNQGVTRGDVFLFFGWFRQAETIKRRIRYVKDAPDLHVLFGWLQIGSVCKVDDIPKGKFPWARYHAHFDRARAGNNRNTLYVARAKLSLPGFQNRVSGAGVFRSFRPALCLADIHIDRRSQRFEPLLALAKFLLLQTVPDRGQESETYSLLFDMNVVFEQYIGELLCRVVCPPTRNARLQVRGKALLRQDERDRFHLPL